MKSFCQHRLYLLPTKYYSSSSPPCWMRAAALQQGGGHATVVFSALVCDSADVLCSRARQVDGSLCLAWRSIHSSLHRRCYPCHCFHSHPKTRQRMNLPIRRCQLSSAQLNVILGIIPMLILGKFLGDIYPPTKCLRFVVFLLPRQLRKQKDTFCRCLLR